MIHADQITLAVSCNLADLEARVRRIVREEIEGVSAPQSRWLDIARAAEYTAMSKEAVRSAEKRGQIKSFRSETGRIRFRTEDLDTFLRGEDG